MDDAAKADLKQRIVAARGYWARFHDVLLDRSPKFLEAYVDFQSAPTRPDLLPRKLWEFIYIAIDLSVNHMYERGGRRHMEYALKAGATPDELLQVVLLTTVLAAHHPVDLGLGILAELAPGSLPEGSADARASIDPAMAASHAAYSDAVWEEGPLSRLHKELIALAVCAAPTCLHEPGIRRHMKAALDLGASAKEIYAVLQLAAALSIHTCTIGIPALDDVMAGKFVE